SLRHGDIVTARWPRDGRSNKVVVKRIKALPGELVTVKATVGDDENILGVVPRTLVVP
ncbi:unnamed protein product, partial [Chrysoparadoxa australica]